MRTTFAALDDALIERLFQPAVDLVADRVGLGRTAAACYCIDIASFAWLVSRVQSVADAVRIGNAGTMALGLALLLLGLTALISLRTLFRRAGRKPVNPLRQSMQTHRGVVLLMLVAQLVQLHAPGLAEAASAAMLLCCAAALYLGACLEPPPARRVWTALSPTAGRA